MMRPDDLTPPAIVAPAEGLGDLAARINAEHEAGEDATRRGLEHFRAAGKQLEQAKKLCGHGKWLPWLKANVRFSERTAQDYMRIAKDSNKTAAAADLRDALRLLTEDSPSNEDDQPCVASSAVQRDEDEEVPALLALQPGCVYFCEGTDAAGGPAFAQIAAIPDAPDYWVWAFAFEQGEHVDYCGRGMRLDGPEGLAELAALCGFMPGPAGWQAILYNPSKPPLAVAFDLLDRRHCRGRYEWCARIPAESREAMIQEAMKRWGVTEEPREEGSAYLGRPTD